MNAHSFTQLENHRLGGEEKPLLIAEISANHDRDLDQALALVDIAADAGWDSLKLQTYSADTLTMASDHASMAVDPVWGHTMSVVALNAPLLNDCLC